MDEAEILERLLYRDAMMLVVDKPAGIPVHPGSGGGETMQDHFTHLRFGLPNDPALAHRLDRETSGCLVLGRHRQALKRLGELFAKGMIKKTYWAVVEGSPQEPQGTIDIALGKASAAKNRWRMQPDPLGQNAVTQYRMLAKNDRYSWLELKPETGRTHQLRVHSAAMGFPILGDRAYGSQPSTSPLHLHAHAIEIPLYFKKPPIMVTANLPLHFSQTLEKEFQVQADDPHRFLISPQLS